MQLLRGTWEALLRRWGMGAQAEAAFVARMKALKALGIGAVIANRYQVRCYRSASDPTLLWSEDVWNLTTTQGLNDTLTNYFKGSAYTAAWYVALVDNAGFGAFAAGDTAAKITTTTPSPPTTNNWAENTQYGASVRQTWTGGSVSSGSVDNSASPASFTMNASGTLNGAFLISNNTKGGATGILYGEASFGSTQPFVSSNVVTVTVTLTQAST